MAALRLRGAASLAAASPPPPRRPPSLVGGRRAAGERGRSSSASASARADDAAAPAPRVERVDPSAADAPALQKAVYRHTLTSMYVAPEDRVADIPKVDWDARRRKREREEIAAAARRLPGGGNTTNTEQGLDALEALLPGVPVGSLDLLKASEWARVAADPPKAARCLLTLRAAFPKADAAAIIRRAPRLALLRSPEEIAQDAAAARAVLDASALGRDDPAAVDAAVELVPELATPKGVATAASQLKKWHPKHDPFELMRKDPTVLVNQDESDLEADPIYGEVTSAG